MPGGGNKFSHPGPTCCLTWVGTFLEHPAAGPHSIPTLSQPFSPPLVHSESSSDPFSLLVRQVKDLISCWAWQVNGLPPERRPASGRACSRSTQLSRTGCWGEDTLFWQQGTARQGQSVFWIVPSDSWFPSPVYLKTIPTVMTHHDLIPSLLLSNNTQLHEGSSKSSPWQHTLRI